MESVKSFVFFVFCVIVLLPFIVLIPLALYGVILFFYESTKCSNCAKAIRGEAIRCPRCGSPLTAEVPEEKINAELYARVSAFVADQRGESEEKLTPDTRLQDDLGVDGDDGFELIEAFCEEFEIQNTSEINLTKYFAPEGCNPFEIYVWLYYEIPVDLYYWVVGREKPREEPNSDIPLTLRNLVKSAEAKQWIPPET